MLSFYIFQAIGIAVCIVTYAYAFQVYWNIPSRSCFLRNITPPLENYNIFVNENHSFYGKMITTLYSDKFGAYPYYDRNNVEHYGGIPQKANLTLHLEKAETDITNAILDEAYDGLAIIDYEEWRPFYHLNWGSKSIYKTKSIEYVLNRTGKISDKAARMIATDEFNKNALRFMSATIQLGKRLRPRAKWGFYGFPYCNTDAGTEGSVGCSKKFKRFNNWLASLLLQEADALFPSIYFYRSYPEDPEFNLRQARAVLDETERVASLFSMHKKIYAFTKLEYNPYSRQGRYYYQKDFCASIEQSNDYGIDGIIFWSTSFGIQQKCLSLKKTVEQRVGPYVQAVVRLSEICSWKRCSGHGRCVSNVPTVCSTYDLGKISYRCKCEKYWFGKACEYNKFTYYLERQKELAIQEELLRTFRRMNIFS